MAVPPDGEAAEHAVDQAPAVEERRSDQQPLVGPVMDEHELACVVEDVPVGEHHSLGLSSRPRRIQQDHQGAGVEIHALRSDRRRRPGQRRSSRRRRPPRRRWSRGHAGRQARAGPEGADGQALRVGDQDRAASSRAATRKTSSGLQGGVDDVRDRPGLEGAHVCGEQLGSTLQVERDDFSPLPAPRFVGGRAPRSGKRSRGPSS